MTTTSALMTGVIGRAAVRLPITQYRATMAIAALLTTIVRAVYASEATRVIATTATRVLTIVVHGLRDAYTRTTTQHRATTVICVEETTAWVENA